ncbi:MAG: choice-of-anchor A family protein [Alphaproteobacteria bacterium]|nr:choice-of-anchor A family protein [Alphaproteobacteria bacterium]
MWGRWLGGCLLGTALLAAPAAHGARLSAAPQIRDVDWGSDAPGARVICGPREQTAICTTGPYESLIFNPPLPSATRGTELFVVGADVPYLSSDGGRLELLGVDFANGDFDDDVVWTGELEVLLTFETDEGEVFEHELVIPWSKSASRVDDQGFEVVDLHLGVEAPFHLVFETGTYVYDLEIEPFSRWVTSSRLEVFSDLVVRESTSMAFQLRAELGKRARCEDRGGDTDGDLVCDDVDQCPGEDDARDDDGDGIPDACDAEVAGVGVELTASFPDISIDTASGTPWGCPYAAATPDPDCAGEVDADYSFMGFRFFSGFYLRHRGRLSPSPRAAVAPLGTPFPLANLRAIRPLPNDFTDYEAELDVSLPGTVPAGPTTIRFGFDTTRLEGDRMRLTVVDAAPSVLVFEGPTRRYTLEVLGMVHTGSGDAYYDEIDIDPSARINRANAASGDLIAVLTEEVLCDDADGDLVCDEDDVCPSVATPADGDWLAGANEANATVFGGVAFRGVVQGALAAAGDVQLTDFQVGATGSPLAASAGGTLTARRGTFGTAIAATAVDLDGTVAFADGSGVVAGPLPDLDALETHVGFLSADLATLPVNGAVAVASWGAVTLTGTDPVLDVFALTASQVSRMNGLTVDVPPGAAVVIEVSGSGPTFSGFSTTLRGADAGRILWHLPAASAARVRGATLPGTLLAPYAAVDLDWGTVDGRLIAASLTGRGTVHDRSFAGEVCAEVEVPDTSPRCAVAYRIDNSWGTGFTATVTFTNEGPMVSGWEAGWRFTQGERIVNSWNVSTRQAGATVTARDVGWNGHVPTGGSVSFGFQGRGSPAALADVTFAGATCRMP